MASSQATVTGKEVRCLLQYQGHNQGTIDGIWPGGSRPCASARPTAASAPTCVTAYQLAERRMVTLRHRAEHEAVQGPRQAADRHLKDRYKICVAGDGACHRPRSRPMRPAQIPHSCARSFISPRRSEKTVLAGGDSRGWIWRWFIS